MESSKIVLQVVIILIIAAFAIGLVYFLIHRSSSELTESTYKIQNTNQTQTQSSSD